MKCCELQKAVDRIERMEICFDILVEAVETNKADISKEPYFNALLQELIQYYESGQWLYDYELDEKGYLPQNMKRGVLSEDGVYNLLTYIKSLIQIT